MSENLNYWVWLDLEMTGLDVASNRILEIATLVTDTNLNIIAEGPCLAIQQSEELLTSMHPWCVEQHGKSGLTERVRKSTVTEKEAEAQTLEFLSQYLKPDQSPLCGNSICLDRRFLHAYMPQLEAFFHYRHLDVSTIKELARQWAPAIVGGFKKHSMHLALEDIRESVAELRYYRDNAFIGAPHACVAD